MRRSSLNSRLRQQLLPAVIAGALLASLPAALAQQTQEAGKPLEPLVSILELMEKTITPATNTIWSFYQPPAEESDWFALEEAAITLLGAVSLNAAGGTGPMDNEWVQDPRWEAFNSVMLSAARDALAAIRARDHDALLTASDVLYPPCEGCHLQFNPAVVNAQ